MRAKNIDDWIATAGHLWFEGGWDTKNRGFFEHLKSDGTPNYGEHRRVRVQLRQIFSIAFCEYHQYTDFASKRLDEAVAFVWEKLWAPDGVSGFPHIVDEQCHVIDARRDMYDHAFALLAFAWAYRATGQQHLLEKLQRISEFVESSFRHPVSGFHEATVPELPRRQNPHMHCFEAYLAIYDATADELYLKRAHELFALFEKHFWDAEAGVLREYFSDDWQQPDALERWSVIEPGHMAEWVWLLRQYQRVSNVNVGDYCSKMYANALKLGFDHDSQCLWDEVTPEGVIKQKTRRVWPQTELLKAATAELLAGREDALPVCVSSLHALRKDYLSGVIEGGWRDQFDAKGQSMKDLMPASSHYHILIALHEARQCVPLMKNYAEAL